MLWRALFQSQGFGGRAADGVHCLEIRGGFVVFLQLVVGLLGLALEGAGLFQQLGSGVPGQTHPVFVAGEGLPVHEAGAVDVLLACKVHGMPLVAGEEGQPQLGDQQMLGGGRLGEGTQTGVDIVAPLQRHLPQQLDRQGSGGPPLVPEHHLVAGQGFHRVGVAEGALGSDCRQQPQLFTAGAALVGQQPPAQPGDVLLQLFPVQTARRRQLLFPQKQAGRGKAAPGAFLQLAAGVEQPDDLGPVLVQSLRVQSPEQVHHRFLGAGIGGLQSVGSSGVQNRRPGRGKDDAVQAIGVGGAVDALHRPGRLPGQIFHKCGFAAAGPRLDEVKPEVGLVGQIAEIAPESAAGTEGAQKEVDIFITAGLHKENTPFLPSEYARQDKRVFFCLGRISVPARPPAAQQAVFLPGGGAAPQMALGLVHRQHLGYPGSQKRVDPPQTLGDVLVYRTF